MTSRPRSFGSWKLGCNADWHLYMMSDHEFGGYRYDVVFVQVSSIEV